jgi:protocatechuate 3,4-dioxygenase beta subunit
VSTGGVSTGGTVSTGGVATGGVSTGGVSTGGAGVGGTPGTGGAGNFTFAPIGDWEDVPTCMPSYSDGAGQGPFMIHELEVAGDESMYRQDIRGRYNPQAEPGVEMQLHLRILDGSADGCGQMPVKDVEVYVWNTDAQGYYSGFGTRGQSTEQNPDSPYAGVPNQNDLDTVDNDRFCRGVQLTGDDGVVSFRSIFPGWYNGRDVHIHVLLLKKDSTSKGRATYTGSEHYLTTQFYFDPDLTDEVHKSTQPYLRRTEGALATTYTGAIAADEGGNSGIHADAVFENGIVVAKINILVDPSMSLTSTNNPRP